MAILASGDVPIVQTVLYTTDSGRLFNTSGAKIEKITLFNLNAAAQTAILYVTQRASTTQVIRQFVLQQNEGGEYLEPGEILQLQGGDQISGETTTASAVNFVILGERV